MVAPGNKQAVRNSGGLATFIYVAAESFEIVFLWCKIVARSIDCVARSNNIVAPSYSGVPLSYSIFALSYNFVVHFNVILQKRYFIVAFCCFGVGRSYSVVARSYSCVPPSYDIDALSYSIVDPSID